MKPKYRYNRETKEWDRVLVIDLSPHIDTDMAFNKWATEDFIKLKTSLRHVNNKRKPTDADKLLWAGMFCYMVIGVAVLIGTGVTYYFTEVY